MSRPPPLEKSIEKAVVDYAKKRGCLVRKMNGQGARSWPDRMFIGPPDMPPRGVHFNELKRKGKLPTPAQAKMLLDLLARGVFVTTSDSSEEAKEMLDAWLDDSSDGAFARDVWAAYTRMICEGVLRDAGLML